MMMERAAALTDTAPAGVEAISSVALLSNSISRLARLTQSANRDQTIMDKAKRLAHADGTPYLLVAVVFWEGTAEGLSDSTEDHGDDALPRSERSAICTFGTRIGTVSRQPATLNH